MSKPILGVLLGIAAGVFVGIYAVFHFEVSSMLDRFCIVASVVLIMQWLGATIAGALGKPHQGEES